MWLESALKIDIRSLTDFEAGHMQGSIHFEGVADLSSRQYELPEAISDMLVIHNADQLQLLKLWLEGKSYPKVRLQVWSEAFGAELLRRQVLAKGKNLSYAWQANPAVRRFVQDFAKLVPTENREGLDIACGSGRDLVYLAMQGWSMTGVELRVDMLEKAQALALRQQVVVNLINRDCEQSDDPFTDIINEKFGLITVARYLHRPLFPVIKRLLAPKGFVVYHTFMQGCEAFGSPKNPRFLLAPNELEQVFADYKIWVNETLLLSDGRPVSAFIAQKTSTINYE